MLYATGEVIVKRPQRWRVAFLHPGTPFYQNSIFLVEVAA